MSLIQCINITRTYCKGGPDGAVVTPLKDLTLSIDEGEFISLMGPSGSGKTTLLNMLAGIDRPTAGQLIIAGTDIAKLSRSKLANWRSEYIGYIFQLYNLVPVLNAYENVELPLLLHNLSRKERHRKVSTALELVGLANRYTHYPRQLSGGQEQRVAIARAIVTDPKIIVADEPTGDLDAESAVAIMNLLTNLNKELNKTMIMVTHDAKCATYADKTLHLEKGTFIEAGTESENAKQQASAV